MILLDVVRVDYVGKDKVEEKSAQPKSHQTSAATKTYLSQKLPFRVGR